ncbi:MAG: creatininase family protein [Gemmatimonadaceae bacterium]|jgi:creatinine amidohydrolase/Fe(II)-dependent formamide hydrolase-like protein|nr:creatininase family protein [Gemmatimonadaceae bacterium]
MRTSLLLATLLALGSTSAAAQQPPAAAAGQAPPRRPANAPRTIEGVNTVWIEQLTQPELRDMIRDGYTTVLVMTGGVEDNSANLVLDKHNINNRLHGEMIARRLGKTLVAPLVTLEPGNPGTTITPGRAGPMITQATYRALLFDIGNFLRSMGFKEIYYLGDSGGNAGGMRFAADSLTKLYANDTARVVFKHVAEYYNHTSHVQPFIQNELKIPEQIRIGASTGSSGLHEELAIDATMALVDPVSIRYPQRVKAGEAEINGVKFESLEWLQEIGRKVAELRTKLTVDAITAYRATLAKP